LQEQESRESCEKVGPGGVVRTKGPRILERTSVQTELWKQGSRNSSENKGLPTVVRTVQQNKGAGRGVKKGLGKL
jgi:hypothetical protein